MIDLCNAQQLKELLARHGFHFSKAKGQNFLIQSWVPRQIVEYAEVDKGCGVLEIGPGVGPLTQQLCLGAGKVAALEVDKTLRPILAPFPPNPPASLPPPLSSADAQPNSGGPTINPPQR